MCLFLITGAKGRLLLILSSRGCLQANFHAIIYLFLFWKVEEPAFPFELSLPFKVCVCVCLCNNNDFLSFSSCPSQWTGNRCQEKTFTPTTPVIPNSKLDNWMGE